MGLTGWSWLFLGFYIGLMLAFGWMGSRRVKSADDFATARSSYGPVFLAFAFAATVASGATFLGAPGIAYEIGTSAIWLAFLYPTGAFVGILICMKLINSAGHRFGSRSIPEFLGDRYQSEAVRILVTLFSLLMVFYLAGQLVAGIVIFETMLGLEPIWALLITATVIGFYVVLGGAHADILTDGVQGMVMVVFGVVIVVLFVTAAGFDGGIPALLANLKEQDPNLVGALNKTSPLTHSWWAVFSIFIAHIPLGLLPHIGNKIWALESDRQRKTFVKLAYVFGLTMGMMGIGGVLARGVLGDQLLAEGAGGNSALPTLFIALFPAPVAALLGVAILAAVMSTADGLVVTASQLAANDIYRLTLVPRFSSHLDEETVERRTLAISRVATVVVIVGCAILGWLLRSTNVALLVLMGTGGMMSAFAGPLVLGTLWKGVTRAGALWGLVSGLSVFVVTHRGLIAADWFPAGTLHSIAVWLEGEAPNPFSCAAMGIITSVLFTWAVSKVTDPLPERHLEELFRTAPEAADLRVGRN